MSRMKSILSRFAAAAALPVALGACAGDSQLAQTDQAVSQSFDLTTLAGKLASIRATAPPDIRFSARLEFAAEGDEGTEPGDILAPGGDGTAPVPNPALLDGDSIQGPAVTVNLDRGGAPQNETAIAVDPTNPNRVVAGANDYVAGTWGCFINGVPCSAFGDGYSGTYFSNDGGASWCCSSSDP